MQRTPRQAARAVLSAAKIAADQDFESLNAEQTALVAAEAGAVYAAKHGRPMPADSTAFVRKRYGLLKQRART